jgi:hypothetical protein
MVSRVLISITMFVSPSSILRQQQIVACMQFASWKFGIWVLCNLVGGRRSEMCFSMVNHAQHHISPGTTTNYLRVLETGIYMSMPCDIIRRSHNASPIKFSPTPTHFLTGLNNAHLWIKALTQCIYHTEVSEEDSKVHRHTRCDKVNSF